MGTTQPILTAVRVPEKNLQQALFDALQLRALCNHSAYAKRYRAKMYDLLHDAQDAPSSELHLVAPRKSPRLQSLDVFRGLTVAWMIFVDNAGDAFPEIDHSPWDGVALADFVMREPQRARLRCARPHVFSRRPLSPLAHWQLTSISSSASRSPSRCAVR